MEMVKQKPLARVVPVNLIIPKFGMLGIGVLVKMLPEHLTYINFSIL